MIGNAIQISRKKQKRILILGATNLQIPLINRAKEMGFYVIVCTYDPTEPGIKFADEFHNVSTINKEAVLELARERCVDAVTSWATDVGVAAAAYAADVLGLEGNPLQTVTMLTEKDSFREFLTIHGFLTPKCQVLSEVDIHLHLELTLTLPVIVKPVDSSGGRGVTRVTETGHLIPAACDALSYSRKKKVIVEEAIEMAGPQIHGDGFVKDGRLVFMFLGDHHFGGVNNVVPVATSWPSRVSGYILSKLTQEIDRCIQQSGFRFGPINIEARIDPQQNIYIIELAPRGGGHSSSELTKLGSGVDLPLALLKCLEGQKVYIEKSKSECVAYYLIHSKTDGIFLGITIKPEIKKHITSLYMKVAKGDTVRKYKNMRDALGVIHLSFDEQNAMENMLEQIHNYFFVDIKQQP